MAIFTKISKEDVRTVLRRFPMVPEGDFQSVGVTLGTVNTFYRIEFPHDGIVYYLKIDEVGDLERLRNETLIMRCLEKNTHNLSFHFPIPLKTEISSDWTILANKPILLFTEIGGRSLFGHDLRPKHLMMLGEKLSELHNVTLDSRIRPHRFDMSGLERVHQEIKNPLGIKHPELAAFVFQKLRHLKSNEPGKLKTVLIHADLFPENILWIKNSLSGILDFEAAGSGPALFDVAVCLNALCHDNKNFDREKITAFLAGYQKHHPFSKTTSRLLGYYLEMTSLRFLLTRLRDFELAGCDKKASHFKDYREYLHRFDELKLLAESQLY